VDIFVQQAAEQDILLQVEWYADGGLPLVGARFSAAVIAAIKSLARRPMAGPPRPMLNPQLAGLRTWPIKGFPAFRIYYLVREDVLTVVRVLNTRRNTDTILTGQGVTVSGPAR
jgi:toxin ParE1/3/4